MELTKNDVVNLGFLLPETLEFSPECLGDILLSVNLILEVRDNFILSGNLAIALFSGHGGGFQDLSYARFMIRLELIQLLAKSFVFHHQGFAVLGLFTHSDGLFHQRCKSKKNNSSEKFDIKKQKARFESRNIYLQLHP